ncbi:MAG: phosphatase PAP2 family protein [Actinomycetota bacterium]
MALSACAGASSVAFVVAAFLVRQHPSDIDREVQSGLDSRSFEPLLELPMEALELASSSRASFMLGVAVGLFFAIRRADWRPGVLMMIAFVGVVIQADVLKSVFARADPADWATGDVTGSSFPSGHIAQAVAVWGTFGIIVAMGLGRRGRIAVGVCVAALIAGSALSRLVLGAHWITDVVGGLGVGGVWFALVCAVALNMPSLRSQEADEHA